jgi:hypothetical protein
MVANRMLTNLYAIVGYQAAMGSLQQMHDAVERALVIRSYTDGMRSRSAADAELERIGVKVASRRPPSLLRPMPGKPQQLPKPGRAPRRNND